MAANDVEADLAEVRALDPELLERPDTRQLVELGLEIGQEVTAEFGTPAAPAWASGPVQPSGFMAFHNGGADGHTSVGPRGSGVPRNVLVIAGRVNAAAGREIYEPLARAAAFYAAEGHDRFQLCGRALLPEGLGEGRGDERLSAEYARDRYLAAGGDPALAQMIYDGIMATAFDPRVKRQNVAYERWRRDLHDPEALRGVLGQELVACADMLSTTGPSGALRSIEHTLELLTLNAKDHIVQERLSALGIPLDDIRSPEDLLQAIMRDDQLTAAFTAIMIDEWQFHEHFLRYSDEAIHHACGSRIDELFPGGRHETAMTLSTSGRLLSRGIATPMTIWHSAKDRAERHLRPRAASAQLPAEARPESGHLAAHPGDSLVAAARDRLDRAAALNSAAMIAVRGAVSGLRAPIRAATADQPDVAARLEALITLMGATVEEGYDAVEDLLNANRRRIDDLR